jgi:hypothetical protein
LGRIPTGGSELTCPGVVPGMNLRTNAMPEKLTVLVVDDELHIRRAVRNALRELTEAVVEAGTALELRLRPGAGPAPAWGWPSPSGWRRPRGERWAIVPGPEGAARSSSGSRPPSCPKLPEAYRLPAANLLMLS